MEIELKAATSGVRHRSAKKSAAPDVRAASDRAALKASERP